MRARTAVAEIQAYELMAVLRRDFLRLDLNESNWGCSPAVLAAMANPAMDILSFYPDYRDLEQEVERVYGLTPDRVLFSNGADDGIRAVMQTFVDPGEKVVLAQPSFGMIDLHARVMGAQIVPVPYQSDLIFPVAGFRKAAEGRPRLIGIVRPDSPCGGVISREDLEGILAAAPDSLVMLDETYTQFLGESCLDLLRRFPNLIVLQSFSKALGLAGVRLGMVAAAPELVTQMRKVNPPFAVNGLAARAGAAALKDPEYLSRVVAGVQNEKSWLGAQLENLGIAVRTSPANFVLAAFGARAGEVHRGLLERGILVKNLDKIPVLKGCFRIAVAPREQGERLVTALKEIRGRL